MPAIMQINAIGLFLPAALCVIGEGAYVGIGEGAYVGIGEGASACADPDAGMGLGVVGCACIFFVPQPLQNNDPSCCCVPQFVQLIIFFFSLICF